MICAPPQGLAHTVSEYFVHPTMTLCPGGHEEHLLHCFLSFIEENVSPSWHCLQVIIMPDVKVPPQGGEGSNPDEQIGQLKHPYVSLLKSIHVF